MEARVDKDLCISCGVCVDIAPEVFELDEDDLSEVVDQDAGDDDLLQEAAESCPTEAIILEDEDGNQVYP
jgi:ferredoxin